MDKEEGVMKGDQQTFFCHEFRKAALQTVELDLAIEQWVQELWLRPMACHRSHDKETLGRSESVCIVTFRRFIAASYSIIYLPISFQIFAVVDSALRHTISSQRSLLLEKNIFHSLEGTAKRAMLY